MEAFLTPVLALIVWTLFVFIIMYARRIPAMNKAGIKPQDAVHPRSLDTLPAHARAGADNYNHLMEQPTIFYALMFYMALTNDYTSLSTLLAWGYVSIRIVHSLIQLTINKVILRFACFMLSTLTLIVLAITVIV